MSWFVGGGGGVSEATEWPAACSDICCGCSSGGGGLGGPSSVPLSSISCVSLSAAESLSSNSRVSLSAESLTSRLYESQNLSLISGHLFPVVVTSFSVLSGVDELELNSESNCLAFPFVPADCVRYCVTFMNVLEPVYTFLSVEE